MQNTLYMPSSRRNYKHGFTLVELMVVLAIIGILALISLPKIGWYIERARVVAIRSFVRDTLTNWEPIAYYNFNEIDPSGSVQDEQANYPLSPMGALDTGQLSRVASIESLPGLWSAGDFLPSTWLYTQQGVPLSGQSFFVMHWIRTLSQGGQTYTILNTSSSDGFRFWLNWGKIAVLIGKVGHWYYEWLCWSAETFNDGRWHHLWALFDKWNKKVVCYFDGKEVGGVSIPQEEYWDFPDYPVRIGNGLHSDFSGALDEVMILKRRE